MNSADIFDFLRFLANAFYRFLLKISINAHQVIAHWRVRIQKQQQQNHHQSSAANVNLAPKSSLSTATNVELNDNHILRNVVIAKEATEEPQQTIGPTQASRTLFAKTPNLRRIKLHSILRRLSIRNFMEYCVIALNEASSSGCSNKFDLSTHDKPVWLLGKYYELPQDTERLIDDIRSKLWITYRRNFPPIDENTRYTTDRGFGCMIRCGQMVLANALLCKTLGRDWRWSPDGLDNNPVVYAKVLKLFQDKVESIYSIHNIVQNGQQEGKTVGEWFGPNTIAQALKRMSTSHATKEPNESDVLISIDAALDNVVVIDEIKSKFENSKAYEATESGSEKSLTQWTPGILFIQLRLGLTKINPLYFAALKKTFQFKNSLGIIGGRPNHALYLVGYTDDDIIYLDPHSTQQFIDLDTSEARSSNSSSNNNEQSAQTEEPTTKPAPVDGTYHCNCPERMPIDRLDPSLALCFYFHTEQEFDNWCKQSEELLIKTEQAPMFEIAQSRPSDWNVNLTATSVRGGSNISGSIDSKGVSGKHAIKSGDKFTLLGDQDESEPLSLDIDPANIDSTRTDKIQSPMQHPDNSQSNDDEEFEMLG